MQSFASTNPGVLESATDHAAPQEYAALGIVATGLGTLLAVSFIPDDPAPQGALFFSALAMAAGLAAAPLAAAIRSPKSLLRAEYLLALAPIYWLLLDLLQGVYPMRGISPEQIRSAFIAIGLFVGALWVAVAYRPWRVPAALVRSVSEEFSTQAFFSLAVAAFILGMLKFAIPTNFDVAEMWYYVGQGRWVAPWGRGQLGGSDAFIDQLQYFGYILPALAVIVGRRAGWGNARTLLCGGMAITMMVFLSQSGSRRVIGVVFGIAFITWVLTERRLRTRHVLIGAGAVAALLLSLQVMLEYRRVGLAALFDSENNEPILERDYLRVDDNFYRLCQIIELIPDHYPHTYYKYFVYVLVRPIPRVFWPGKPVDPGFDLPRATGTRGVSLSSSVIGELYMAAGFIGIALGGWFYGRLSGMASQLLNQRTTAGAVLIYATLTMSLFGGVRSMLELVLVNYAMLAWVGLSRVYTHFRGSVS